MPLSPAKHRKRIGLSLIGLAGLVVLFAALNSNRGEELEQRTWDWTLQHLAKGTSPDPRIKVVLINQSSLDYHARDGQFWVWPRGMYVPTLQFLARAGARAVAFDMIFSEPDNQPGDDEAFASALSHLTSVLAVNWLSKNGEAVPARLPPSVVQRLQSKHLEWMPFAQLPVPPLVNAAKLLGSVSSVPETDGMYRRARAGMLVGNQPVLGLAFALAQAAGFEQAVLDAIERSDEEGRLPVRFRAPPRNGERDQRAYSIADLFQSEVKLQRGEKPPIDPREFKDSLVLVGVFAPGLADVGPTPINRSAAGVFFHADVLDNILQGDFVWRSPLWPSFLFGAIWVFAVPLILGQLRRIRYQLAALAFLFALLWIVRLEAAEAGVWLPLFAPFAGMLLGSISVPTLSYYLEGRHSQFLRSAFQYYVSPPVVDQIVADPGRLVLGGERRELTIFFSDIAGFTSISESLEPPKLVQLLNLFLGEMSDIITASGGTVDKYVGDAIVAFWNAPLPLKDHACCAARAALACQKRLDELQNEFVSRFGKEVRMRVGLHTGEVGVGNFGSAKHFNYTIIGDAANFASRLEGVNKVFGTYTLVSETTALACGEHFYFRKVARVRVVGKQEAIAIYQPFLQKPAFAEEYEAALVLFESGNRGQALEAFQKIKGDAVSQAYVSRLQTGALDGADPVWSLKEK